MAATTSCVQIESGLRYRSPIKLTPLTINGSSTANNKTFWRVDHELIGPNIDSIRKRAEPTLTGEQNEGRRSSSPLQHRSMNMLYTLGAVDKCVVDLPPWCIHNLLTREG